MTAEPLAEVIDLFGSVPTFPQAECRDADPEDFFPPTGWGNAWVTEQAKLMCADCPERLRCLAWALEHHEWGIWGGTTDKERAQMRRDRRKSGG